ncbi:MAG: glycosyltransferase [Chloroflexi bacterium]|nr:glycosyltransferase [Chloroflexota bacterium]
MHFVIFGLTLSSSWGNGHATTWRGVLKALHRAGHRVTFFERNVPYYAASRDLPDPEFCRLVVYDDWAEALSQARAAIADTDVAIVTSYCADGLAANRLMLDAAGPLRVFYDIDTPVTLAELDQHGIATKSGAQYLTPELMPEFDLYLSFTGGPTLDVLERRWGVRLAKPLYCSVDPEIHFPVPPAKAYRCALSYLGTYSADRQPSLERLLFRPAEARPWERLLVAGSQYPDGITWPANVRLLEHLPPGDHSAFYCSSRLALNITREAMLRTGYAPSVRLFEAASCGVPVVSDAWPGLEEFFEPGVDILVASEQDDVLAALDRSAADLAAIGGAARERALAEHTCTVRAQELIDACQAAASGSRAAVAS